MRRRQAALFNCGLFRDRIYESAQPREFIVKGLLPQLEREICPNFAAELTFTLNQMANLIIVDELAASRRASCKDVHNEVVGFALYPLGEWYGKAHFVLSS